MVFINILFYYNKCVIYSNGKEKPLHPPKILGSYITYVYINSLVIVEVVTNILLGG